MGGFRNHFVKYWCREPDCRRFKFRAVAMGKEQHMLGWAATFFVIAIIAAVLGFSGIAGAAAGIAKLLFVIFLIIFAVFVLMGRRPPA